MTRQAYQLLAFGIVCLSVAVYLSPSGHNNACYRAGVAVGKNEALHTALDTVRDSREIVATMQIMDMCR